MYIGLGVAERWYDITTMQETNSQKQKSISILLGAGFSAPAGFPLGSDVNDYIKHFDFDAFSVDRFGCLLKRSESCDPNGMERGFQLCKKGRDQYLSYNDGNFNYECFFDFLYEKDGVVAMTGVDYGDNILEAVGEAQRVYKKIVQRALGIRENLFEKDIEKVYQNFLSTLKVWSQDAIINVHTLNHDSLFESFGNLDSLNGLISDGFSSHLSPFRDNMERSLEEYVGIYDKPIRLFKLHGSFDYARCSSLCGSQINPRIVKLPHGISSDSIYMISEDNKKEYPSIESAYVLTGNLVKRVQYEEPFPSDLMKRFGDNIQTSSRLIIIGYGANDKGINDILKQFDHVNKSVVYIGMNPTNAMHELATQLGTNVRDMDITNVQQLD